jgi:hypothetical protein
VAGASKHQKQPRPEHFFDCQIAETTKPKPAKRA